MRRSPLLPALALALGLTACAPKAAEATPSPAPAPSPVPVAPAPPAELEWTDSLTEKDYTAGDGTVVLRLRYVFPAVAQPGVVAAWDNIGAYYASEAQAYLENAQEAVLQAQDDYTIAQASGFDFLPYTEGFTYQITRQTADLVSIRRTYSSTAGGADIYGFQFSETFDLSTGSRLGLDDLLAPGWEEPLMDQVFLQAGKLSWHPFTLEALTGQFNADSFYLTDEALVVFYQPTAFGPGTPLLECSIPYDSLTFQE